MGKRKKKKKNLLNGDKTFMEISTVESLQFDFDTIKVATDDFSDTNKIGEGGFGAVYKGRLPNGRDVAVKRKRLSEKSQQGKEEFKNEVLSMTNLQHRNLVKLLGFCLNGKEEEMLLVYEFIANASLDKFIFDSKKRRCLDWSKRCKIIGGIARGLLYLHDDYRVRIIHRDLKASNVLLDAEMNPKISDFGLAIYLEETDASDVQIAGTIGYMAPEYAMHREISDKSDVFSFGVLVLEIVSGQKNTHYFENEDSYCISYAWKIWKEGTHTKFIDPTLLDGSSSMSDILRCIHIGLLCVQEKAADRPTMAFVVNMFYNLSLTLQIPTEPAHFNSKDSVNEDSITEDSVNEDSSSELSGR